MTYKNAGNTTRQIKWYTPESVKTAKSIDGKMKSFTSRNLYQNCFIETNILPEKGMIYIGLLNSKQVKSLRK